MEKTIGKNIRRQREQRRMSQTELAALLGVSTPSVSKIECGVNNLTIRRLKQISDVFNLSMQELVYDDGQYGIKEINLGELSRLKHLVIEREIHLNLIRTRLIALHEALRNKRSQ